MFRRKRSQVITEVEINMLAGLLAFYWIAIKIWQSESDSAKERKVILLKAGARANYLFQRPVVIEHLHKLDLATEERIALDSLRTDIPLRSLVMQAQRILEQVPHMEKPDPKLMEIYGAEYPRAPEIEVFDAFIATLEQKLAPLQAKMDSDPLFVKGAAQGTVPKKPPAWVRWSGTWMKKDIERAWLTASVLFAKNLEVEKVHTANDLFITWTKAQARAYIVFDKDIPRGCARLVNLAAEEVTAIEALRADPLLCELVVQSQRYIAGIKLSEGRGTEWGMESQILGEFGASFPRYMTPSQYRSYLNYIEKTLASYKKQVRKLAEQFE